MINVLIVDDSAVVRSLVENVMKEDARFHILGFAENGAAAVEQNRKLAPDLIVMDITMPIMNGIEASKKILETSSPAIVAFTTEDSEETAFKCYEANIIEIITKPNFSTMNKTMIENLCDKLAIIAQEHKQRQIRKKKRNDLLEKRRKETQEAELAESQKKGGGKTPAQQDDIGENSENFKTLQMNIEAAKTKKYDALLIGSSTGGPVAVEKILKDLGKDFPLPVLITQHIDAQFDRQFAKWLTESSGFSTELAEDGVFIEPGHAYIAPANHHLSVQYLGGKYSIHLNDDPPLHFLKPSVDKMFSTCSQVFKGKLIAAILTGMGRDGADGIKDIASKGGETIAQDEDTCVVFGMPKSAIETGAIKEVLPLEDIGNYIRLIAR